ncbi:SGNH/GDSL hydrolase family protein [Rhizobium sp. Leaf341]|uniref:SGNH/GDSL hydrolase family protein n=1 Tax=Rhizobium sp. Leaf341 TaxID=1736344 RepID=UPI000714607C|nr:SGNH/GDSL hydrolase family protein [Rhizobium sp. Leaf341]KQR75736.1 hypothetical protein ASG03_18875 [Rhizobium sp. Leaf341]
MPAPYLTIADLTPALQEAANTDLQLMQEAAGFHRRPGFGLAVNGDSRLEAIMVDGGGSLWPANAAKVKGFHFINVASTLLDGGISLRAKTALSGFRSDQYLQNLDAAIASGASLIAIFGVVNDIAQSGTTGDTAATIFARIKAAALKVLSKGKTPILFTEPGATNFSQAMIAMLVQFNEFVVELTEQLPGILLFDLATIVWDQAATTTTAIAFKAGYSSDGVHYTKTGNYWIGKGFAAFLSGIVKPYPNMATGSFYVPGNGNIGQLTNAMFATTAAASGAGISGTVPTGYTPARTGTGTVVASVIDAPDGIGKAVRLVASDFAAGDRVTFEQAANIANFAGGNLIEAGAKVMINSGADKLRSCALWGNTSNEANPISDLYTTEAGGLPTDLHGKTLRHRSVPYALVAGFTWVNWQVRMIADAAFTGQGFDITIWNPTLRKRNAF